MTTPIATDTELSAVNSILGSIGQSPITVLAGNPNPEVTFIKNIFDECTKDVQNEGWHFNTEHGVPVQPDSSGQIAVPSNYLRYDLADGQADRQMDLVKRNGKLYDKVHHTDVFTVEKLELDIVYLFDFTDLPSVFQRYIVALASSRAAAQLITNPQLVQLLQQQEARTRAAVMDYECEQGDHSFLGWPHGTSYRSYQPYKALNRR